MWRRVLPLLAGYGASLACPMRKELPVPLQPPDVAFPVMWTILYLLLGEAWHRATPSPFADVSLGACTLLLTCWPILYSCMDARREAAYLIATTVSSVVVSMVLHPSPIAPLLLTPLLAWLLIAFQLNWCIATRSELRVE